MKNILIIFRSSPFSGYALREALDFSLIFASIEQNVSVLFENEATCCLHTKQQPEQAGLKNYFKTMKMLELFEIDNLYVCRHSLNQFNLSESPLLIDVKILSEPERNDLINKQDFVVTF